MYWILEVLFDTHQYFLLFFTYSASLLKCVMYFLRGLCGVILRFLAIHCTSVILTHLLASHSQEQHMRLQSLFQRWDVCGRRGHLLLHLQRGMGGPHLWTESVLHFRLYSTICLKLLFFILILLNPVDVSKSIYNATDINKIWFIPDCNVGCRSPSAVVSLITP